MREIRCKYLTLLLIFGCLGLLQAATVSKEFRKTFDFRPGGEIGVRNVNGNISVEPWNRESVEVYAEIEVKAGSHRDAEKFMEHVKIITEHRNGRLQVEVDYPRIKGGDGILDWVFRRKPQVKVEFWIRVPSRVDLELKSVNGGIEVSDVEGRAKFGTTNGRIDAEGMRGSVDAHSVNGGLRVELNEVDDAGEMSFHTTNGGIDLYLPRDVEADIEASTTNGSISTDFPLEIRGRFNKKRIRGRINGGSGLIDLHTVNGSIRINEE